MWVGAPKAFDDGATEGRVQEAAGPGPPQQADSCYSTPRPSDLD
jgi:hypothetical protein